MLTIISLFWNLLKVINYCKPSKYLIPQKNFI